MSLLFEGEEEVIEQAIAIGKSSGVGTIRRALEYWWALRCLQIHGKSSEVALASSFGRSINELKELQGKTKEELIKILERRLTLMDLADVCEISTKENGAEQ